MLGSLFVFRFGSKFFALLRVAGSVFVSLVVSIPAIAQGTDADLLARVGAYVEGYYARAQTLLATETVTVQPVTSRVRPDGPPRRIVNEVRIEWDAQAGSAPRAVREIVKATGARFGPPDRPDCVDPRSLTPEQLGFLLPSAQPRFRLSIRGVETTAGARARRIDYEPRVPEPPRVRWDGRCGWVDTFGRTRGSVWVDVATGAVLRFTERLSGRVTLPGPPNPDAPEFTAERADTTIEYKRFAFTDPEESLLLPAQVESVTFIRNSGVPRVRVTRTFTNYRRFLTAGRVLP